MEEIPWWEAVTDLGVVTDGRLRFDRQVFYATLHRLRLLKLPVTEAGQIKAL
jgi:hypothetical protein